jgi:hypothetical protein
LLLPADLPAPAGEVTSAAVTPSARSRSGLSMTRISRSIPPTRSMPPTPRTLCSWRATTSSTNQDSSSGVITGFDAA